MAAPNITKITADVNFWAQYRHPDPANYVPLDEQQVQAFYRLQNFPQPAVPAPQGANPQYRDLGPGQPLNRPPAREDDVIRRAFLDRNPLPQLQGDAWQIPLWQGKKFLGEGYSARVGLWEYTDPNPNADVPGGFRQIAVKELKTTLRNPSSYDLRREAEILTKLRQSGSPHIVHMLHNPGPIDAKERLPPGRWNNVVRRIFLEYCALGSLWDLLDRRIKLAIPFSELTIWRIFDCLVDGISVLKYGNELVPDAVTNRFYRPKATFHEEIVHFDLKPANILLAEKRSIHPVHPLCKISDFGLATEIKQPQREQLVGQHAQSWLNFYESKRKWGTRGYFAPEQFTKRWDYDGWQNLDPGVDIAGIYETTNTWGVGCIIYQLITMSRQPPNYRDPFMSQGNLRGVPAAGITYGTNLPAYQQYSELLRDLVQECLYERPSRRPSLSELKENIRFGIEAALSANPDPEPWLDFRPAEPVPPFIPLPPGGPTQAQKTARSQAQREGRKRARKDEAQQAQPKRRRETIIRQRCRYLDEDDTQCKRHFKTTVEGTDIYCAEHRG